MAVNWKIMSQFVKIPPQAWDFIIPRGPVRATVVTRLSEEVALNPQPIPPHESVVGAQLFQNVLTAAIVGQGPKGDTGGFAEALLFDIDDWCGTGWPHKWPWPKPPRGWDEGLVFAGAALAAAGLAAQYDHAPEMQGALGAAAERLADAAGGVR